MNYIHYINQLWEAAKKESLPSSVIALYFFLLNECNVRHWKMPFPCSTSLICEFLRISRQTFTNARNRLAEIGLISYIEGSSRFVWPKYKILQWTDEQTVEVTADLTEEVTEDMTDDMTPINKDIDEKINNTKYSSECLESISTTTMKPIEDPINFDAFMTFFNETMTGRQIPTIKSMSNKRKGMVRARIRQYGKESVAEVIRKAAASDFLNGGTGQFIASIDWLMKPENFTKVLEGNYDKQFSKNNRNYGTDRQFTSTPESRAAEIANIANRLLAEDNAREKARLEGELFDRI